MGCDIRLMDIKFLLEGEMFFTLTENTKVLVDFPNVKVNLILLVLVTIYINRSCPRNVNCIITKNEKDKQHIAVIGDGALTGGQAFEALNHAGMADSNILVV